MFLINVFLINVFLINVFLINVFLIENMCQPFPEPQYSEILQDLGLGLLC